LYRLFSHLVPSSALTYEQYWEFKKKQFSNQRILSSVLGYHPDSISRFVAQWMVLIEAPEYLALDSSLPGIFPALKALQDEANLYVCTNRQFREPTLAQLDRLGLSKFFRQVLVTEKKTTKELLIASSVDGLSAQDWIVGDTGTDIQTGKFLHIRTCAVLSGFFSRESLEFYAPDLIIDSIEKMSLS
jgi:phosphoglycolate phosphatase